MPLRSSVRGKRDATSWYETHDPEFLRECAQATTRVIEKLDRLTQRNLTAPGSDQMNELIRAIDRGRSAA